MSEHLPVEIIHHILSYHPSMGGYEEHIWPMNQLWQFGYSGNDPSRTIYRFFNQHVELPMYSSSYWWNDHVTSMANWKANLHAGFHNGLKSITTQYCLFSKDCAKEQNNVLEYLDYLAKHNIQVNVEDKWASCVPHPSEFLGTLLKHKCVSKFIMAIYSVNYHYTVDYVQHLQQLLDALGDQEKSKIQLRMQVSSNVDKTNLDDLRQFWNSAGPHVTTFQLDMNPNQLQQDVSFLKQVVLPSMYRKKLSTLCFFCHELPYITDKIENLTPRNIAILTNGISTTTNFQIILQMACNFTNTTRITLEQVRIIINYDSYLLHDDNRKWRPSNDKTRSTRVILNQCVIYIQNMKAEFQIDYLETTADIFMDAIRVERARKMRSGQIVRFK